MAGYLITAGIWASFGAGAYWNDNPFTAVFFAGLAAGNLTAASLSSRMDNIDAIIEKRAERIWDAIGDIKNRL